MSLKKQKNLFRKFISYEISFWENFLSKLIQEKKINQMFNSQQADQKMLFKILHSIGWILKNIYFKIQNVF